MMNRILLLLIVWVFVLSGNAVGQSRDKEIVIENDVIRRTITCSATIDAPVIVTSIYLKTKKQELLSPSASLSWFEFSVDHRLLTSALPIWRFREETTRSLQSGGKELRIGFGGPDGLRLTVVVHSFPGATLWRERLELSSEKTSQVLTNHEGQVHLVFPAYSFRMPKNERVQIEETQVAIWSGGDTKKIDNRSSYDERTAESGANVGRNLGHNYMYHPVQKTTSLERSNLTAQRGQLILAHMANRNAGWMFLHEHDAPSQRPEDEQVVIERGRTQNELHIRLHTRAGAYVEGERLSTERPFTTTWATTGWFEGTSLHEGESFVRTYLDKWICENPNTRIPRFYYNTWGMQRDESAKKLDIRGVLTQARVIEDIRLASELNVELFVLDDGWQGTFGDWTPHSVRFPNSLKPIADELSSREMTFGIWLGCLAVDSSSIAFQKHQDWLIRDSLQRPIVGRWNRHVFCLVSDYQKYFVEVCKRLIDNGARYFKWDGMDYHVCASPNHGHGDSNCSEQERIERHRYEMVRSMVDAARQLREYNNNVVIEVDATEPNRAIGFAFLHEGKFFWINNGASAYGDRSQYRAKSMRTVTMAYAHLFPTGLLTYANYPHDNPTFGAQRYNVNSSLIGGRGFWGNLSDMSAEERQTVGASVRLAKRITETFASIGPGIAGRVGASPEVYCVVDRQRAEGQVIAFSGTEGAFPYILKNVRTDSLLAVVRHCFEVHDGNVTIPFNFPLPDVSREAFLFHNQGTGINIISSTSWLKDARIVGPGVMHFIAGAPGRHVIRWKSTNGIPTVYTSEPATVTVQELPAKREYRIEVVTPEPDILVKIRAKK